MENLRFDGVGSCAGGEFDNVDVSGVGKIHGDIKCSKFDISGVAKIDGNVSCDKLSVSGTTTVGKSLIALNLDVSGVLKSIDDIKSKKINVSGSIKTENNLKCENIYSEGMLKVEKNIEAENIDVHGIINCGGFLNCETLFIELSATSKIKEIGATKINIKNSKSINGKLLNIFLPSKFKTNKLVAQVIEGDEINLENCEVKIVRGKNIKIGPKCNIETIEYTGTIEINDKSTVKNIEKV